MKINPIGVIQVTDTLLPGGLERMAVTLANTLPQERFKAHLCATRQGGPLAEVIEPHVARIQLGRPSRFNVAALRRLTAYLRDQDIRLVHAHGTSLFISVVSSLWGRRSKVLWHDHFGRYATEERSVLLFRIATRFVSGVIAVNQQLAEWARSRLRMPSDRVWFVPNFVCEPRLNDHLPDLARIPRPRIVCVANLRPEKGHLLLLQAMRKVLASRPEAHLLLVGRADDVALQSQINHEMERGGLAGHVTWLGARSDVPAILKQCDIGVLSSLSEGLPLALIEYGLAGLPTVATSIGQCPEVLRQGSVGRLVPPGDPEALSRALADLLGRVEERRALGNLFRESVKARYSPEQVLPQICDIYEQILQCRRRC